MSENKEFNFEAVKEIINKIGEYANMDADNLRGHLIKLLAEATGLDFDIIKKIDYGSFIEWLNNKDTYEATINLLKSIPKDVYDLFDNIKIYELLYPIITVYLRKDYTEDIYAQLLLATFEYSKKLEYAELILYLYNKEIHIDLTAIDSKEINLNLAKFLAKHLSHAEEMKAKK